MSRARRGAAALLALVAGSGGCIVEEPSALEARAAPIVGGAADPAHLAVVAWFVSGAQCSGTLVAPRVVVSAAHCLPEDVPDDEVDPGTVLFGGSTDDPIARRTVVRVKRHRRYDPDALGADGLPFDIAMLRLGEDAPAEVAPIPVNLAPLDQDLVGQPIVAVGFGAAAGDDATSTGIKRWAEMPINEIQPRMIGSGDDGANTCKGDSGGPMLLAMGGEERVVGIVSTGRPGCLGNSHQTRVDAFGDELVIPLLDAWSGPCAFDGSCDPDVACPRTPDPDCDPCQADGFCARGCAQVDLDCPLAGFPGDVCDSGQDCESRLCVQALDDARVSYCSEPCDPAAGEAACPAPLDRCLAAATGESACYVSGPSPSAQGAPCTDGGQCRSGMCDARHGICVEACEADADCGGDFACQRIGTRQVCTIPPGGCGAAGGAGGAGAGWAAWLVLAAVGIFAAGRCPRLRHSCYQRGHVSSGRRNPYAAFRDPRGRRVTRRMSGRGRARPS